MLRTCTACRSFLELAATTSHPKLFPDRRLLRIVESDSSPTAPSSPQVVIAIDDSRSMGESRCGHLALEASVALCRAMTQLEVGEMAVVSFGARGNTRLVHPFERPFTDEAGAAVLSQFSFRQDNTIADEPVVDLLRFLGGVLESARARVARSAAGGANQLQQLVLVIADGRFHEKVRATTSTQAVWMVKHSF